MDRKLNGFQKDEVEGSKSWLESIKKCGSMLVLGLTMIFWLILIIASINAIAFVFTGK